MKIQETAHVRKQILDQEIIGTDLLKEKTLWVKAKELTTQHFTSPNCHVIRKSPRSLKKKKVSSIWYTTNPVCLCVLESRSHVAHFDLKFNIQQRMTLSFLSFCLHWFLQSQAPTPDSVCSTRHWTQGFPTLSTTYTPQQQNLSLSRSQTISNDFKINTYYWTRNHISSSWVCGGAGL